MSSQKNIQDELKNLESGLPFNNNQPFLVPEGYFEGLAASVLAKVKSSEVSGEAELGKLSSLLAAIPKITPYSVPFSYFQNNIESTPGLIHETESTVLAYIGKELPYTVPVGYFDNLSEEILAGVTEPKAKVVPLFARKWMKMAAAAVVTGALFFAGLQLFNNKDEVPAIAKKPNNASQTIVAQGSPALEKDLKQASTKELEEFIETVQANAATKENSSLDKQKVEKLLQDVSTAEMESFLSELSTAGDDDLSLTD